MSKEKPKFVLICHEGARLDREILPAWIADFAELAGIVLVRESTKALRSRIRFEYRRSGLVGLLDVFAYRMFHRLFMYSKERNWETQALSSYGNTYSRPSDNIPTLFCESPNRKEVRRFIESCSPDFMLARCKFILNKKTFSIPRKGTFVMHPGICPEYRNAHGCFWAIMNDDLDRVGMTLLKVDAGVDTGPIFGFYSYAFELGEETPNMIQDKVVYENLPALREKFQKLYAEKEIPIDITGRKSGVWGQPRLSSYLNWKFLKKAKAIERISRESSSVS